VIDNHHGAGFGDGQFVMNLDCKVHGVPSSWTEEEEVLVNAICSRTGRPVRIDGDDVVYAYVGYDGIEHERRYSMEGRERKHALRDAAVASRHDHDPNSEHDAAIRAAERARLVATLRAAVTGKSTEHDAGVRYAASLIEGENVRG
jgi:hypothetical protein